MMNGYEINVSEKGLIFAEYDGKVFLEAEPVNE